MTSTWPAPTTVPADRPPMRRGIRNVIVGFFALVFVLAGVRVITRDASTAPVKASGTFYASAGWTIQRAANLSVKIQTDDGESKGRADCAMKGIVAIYPFTAWQTFDEAIRLSLVRNAIAPC